MSVLDPAVREPKAEVAPAVVRVRRGLDTGDPLTVEVVLADMPEKGDTTLNLLLKPGDLLEFLPEQD